VEVGKPCLGCAKKTPQQKRVKRSWEQPKSRDGLDLVDDGEFDYADFVAREFGGAPHRKTGLKWYWWGLAIVVLLAMLGALVGVG